MANPAHIQILFVLSSALKDHRNDIRSLWDLRGQPKIKIRPNMKKLEADVCATIAS
jgi:hypothetical protein